MKTLSKFRLVIAGFVIAIALLFSGALIGNWALIVCGLIGLLASTIGVFLKAFENEQVFTPNDIWEYQSLHMEED